MNFAIIDTNVYIDYWEKNLHHKELLDLSNQFIVRNSSVVLSELIRGARTKEAVKVVEELKRKCSSIIPNEEDWWTAGKAIKAFGDKNGWNKEKRRDFQNDALIGLSAKRYGAWVITSNRKDFDLLKGQFQINTIYL